MNSILNHQHELTQKDRTTYHPLNLFLSRYDNQNTKQGYTQVILSFYNTIGKTDYKELNYIGKEIITSLTPITILSYHNSLIDIYANSTIYYKLSVIRELYNFLIALKLYDGNNPVEIMKRKIKINNDEINGSDGFTIDEIKLIINNSNIKYATLYRLATITGVRVSALLSLTLDNITTHSNGHITINGFDKGNKRFKNVISKDLYDDLIRLSNMNHRTDKIFSLTRQAVNTNLKNTIKKVGIDTNNRKLSFHSFKKSSVTIAGDLSGGDIRKMLEVSHHSSADLTLRIYDQSKHDLENNIGLKIANALN